MNFFDMIQSQEQGRVALIEDDICYTYGDLVRMSLEMSGDKQVFSEPAHKGHVHLICRDKISLQLLEFLATNARGEIPVLVPTDAKVLPKNPVMPEEMCTKNRTEDKDKPCMGVMTSGTTGEPKLWYRSYESWADFFPIQNDIFGIQKDSCMLAQGSLAFTGNLNLYMALFSVGACIVAQNRFWPKEWEGLITKYSVNAIYLIPSKLMCMPRVIKQSHPAVQTIISGSQSLGKEDAGRLKKSFPNATITLYYGASELNYITYVTDTDMTDDQDLIGKPFPGVSVEVQDQNIYVTTPYHVAGVTCPYTLSDCGYIDEAQNLHFVGRSDDIMNIRGRKISAFRIEEILRGQPEIVSAAVLPLTEQWGDEKYSEKCHCILTAFVILQDNKSIDQSLQKRLRERLAHYEMPDRFVVIKDIPQTESGKTDKHKLQTLWKEGAYR